MPTQVKAKLVEFLSALAYTADIAPVGGRQWSLLSGQPGLDTFHSYKMSGAAPLACGGI